MPRQTDQSDGPNTLPLPELNPLLNPVLGQNMGRWAEVYFTSPPEKREEAVLDLLRELQGNDPRREDAVVTSPPSLQEHVQEHASTPAAAPTSETAEVRETLVPCPACGWSNPASHRFCGMCGKSVTEQKSVADLEIADLHVEDPRIEAQQIEARQIEDPRHDQVRNNHSQYAPAEDAAYEPALSPDELPLFQRGRDYREDRGDEIFSYPAASRSYRVYIGIALAIVIFALGYMAWRSMQVTPHSAHVEPLPLPAAATEPAATEPGPPPTLPITSKADTPERTPLVNQPAATQSATGPAHAGTGGRAGPSEAATATPPIPSTGKNLPAETLGGYGAEELATAQRYLNGVGQERNHAEAAKWLWRAIAKHNADAPLFLSDLYLKGDGVGKSCDQARILLDTAARRGTKDAAQRLRHLQAFGCE